LTGLRHYQMLEHLAIWYRSLKELEHHVW
jgi:hypothetical protein